MKSNTDGATFRYMFIFAQTHDDYLYNTGTFRDCFIS